MGCRRASQQLATVDGVFDAHRKLGPACTDEDAGSDSAVLFATMVELEFQFMTDDELDVVIFTGFMSSFVVSNEWVDHTIWTNPSCLEDGIYWKIQRK